jgi:signal transduction histidine kinase
MHWARLATMALASLAAVHLVLTAGFLAAAPTGPAWAGLAIGVAVVFPASALSLLVARRPDGAVVGTVLGLLSLVVAHAVAKEVWLGWLAAAGDPEAWAWLVAATAEDAWWVLVALALLLLFFPDGRLPSRRWRWLPPALLGCAAVTQWYGAVEAAPFRPPLHDLARPFRAPAVWVDVLHLVVFVCMLALFVVCAASLVLRLRRADRIQRLQIKWLALAGIGMPLYPLLCGLEILLWGRPLWVSAAVGIASVVATPIAAGTAVLRHDLYDVDKALAIAVAWGMLTTALLAVYGVTSSIAGAVVGGDSPIRAAVGTAAVALLLVPLRRKLQAFVDARMYPLRRAVLHAADNLHREVSAGRARPEQLQDVLRVVLRDPALRVGYRLPGSDTYLDSTGSAVASGHGVPVMLDHEPTGLLIPSVGPASDYLLREVADRVTTLVEVVRLRAEVGRALREAESSRLRLVELGYEERRRFERDLHDGAQQRLVTLGMSLRVAQRHLADGTVDVNELLDGSVTELATAVTELRHIAHGLRPSSLDDGLPAALSNLVRALPMAVDLDVDDTPLPDAVATTAFFVASEAITNAVKHAEATRITLQVVRRDSHVVVCVTDDGRGGARIGLRSGLADRVAALDGSLDVASPPGGGTEVKATLPVETLPTPAREEPRCAS